MKEELEKIEEILKELPWQSERGAREIEKIIKKLKEDATLQTIYYLAETIDEDGMYIKYKYRKTTSLSFYLRPLRNWFTPCQHCQEKLQVMLRTGNWILGNKQYEPLIELNTTNLQTDDQYEETLEKHKATKKEIDRIGIEGWKSLGKIPS